MKTKLLMIACHILLTLITVKGYALSRDYDKQIVLHNVTMTTGASEKMVAYEFRQILKNNQYWSWIQERYYDLTWSSSDEDVATIDPVSGVVTARKVGTANITAIKNDNSGISATATVTVINPATVTSNMLKENITWVGRLFCHPIYDEYGSEEVEYAIQIKGDTVVDGITYKKAYRFEYAHYTVYEKMKPKADIQPKIFLSRSTPAACLREDNGRIYRLCDKEPDRPYYYNNDYFSNPAPDYLYPHRVNETETHYEVVLYDFNEVTSYYTLCDFVRDDVATINSQDCKAKLFSSELNQTWLVQIEGYGIFHTLLELSYGDFIAPMTPTVAFSDPQDDISSTIGQTICKQYVVDNKGRVLIWDRGIKRSYYDFNHDNKFDFQDLEKPIHRILFPEDLVPLPDLDIDDERYFGEGIENKIFPMDKNYDKILDIDDINLLINALLNENEPLNLWRWSGYR